MSRAKDDVQYHKNEQSCGDEDQELILWFVGEGKSGTNDEG